MRLAFAVIVLSVLAAICFVGLLPAFGLLGTVGSLSGILLSSLAVLIYCRRQVSLEFDLAQKRHEAKCVGLRVRPKMILE